jgi:hypothetical protein
VVVVMNVAQVSVRLARISHRTWSGR